MMPLILIIVGEFWLSPLTINNNNTMEFRAWIMRGIGICVWKTVKKLKDCERERERDNEERERGKAWRERERERSYWDCWKEKYAKRYICTHTGHACMYMHIMHHSIYIYMLNVGNIHIYKLKKPIPLKYFVQQHNNNSTTFKLWSDSLFPLT